MSKFFEAFELVVNALDLVVNGPDLVVNGPACSSWRRLNRLFNVFFLKFFKNPIFCQRVEKKCRVVQSG